MEKIIEANEQHLNDFLEMSLDLWKEDYSSNDLSVIYGEALSSPKNKIFMFLADDIPAAFIYLSVRTDYVEGSESSPTGYIEGIYVKPGFRKSGIAKKLLVEGEKWLRENGCKQIGSDAYIDNKVSYDFHINIGFKEAGKLVTFIKDL